MGMSNPLKCIFCLKTENPLLRLLDRCHLIVTVYCCSQSLIHFERRKLPSSWKCQNGCRMKETRSGMSRTHYRHPSTQTLRHELTTFDPCSLRHLRFALLPTYFLEPTSFGRGWGCHRRQKRRLKTSHNLNWRDYGRPPCTHYMRGDLVRTSPVTVQPHGYTSHNLYQQSKLHTYFGTLSGVLLLLESERVFRGGRVTNRDEGGRMWPCTGVLRTTRNSDNKRKGS